MVFVVLNFYLALYKIKLFNPFELYCLFEYLVFIG